MWAPARLYTSIYSGQRVQRAREIERHCQQPERNRTRAISASGYFFSFYNLARVSESLYIHSH